MLTSVKSAGDYVVDVLAVPFGSPADRDGHGQFFDARTKLFTKQFNPLILYYHSYTEQGKPQGDPTVIGEAVKHWQDAAGVWFRVALDKTKEYARKVWAAALAQKAVASSGTLEHLIRVEADGRIAFWPLAEISLWDLTPQHSQAASPYAVALPAFKSVCHQASRPVPAFALAPNAEAAQQSSKADARAQTPTSALSQPGEYPMKYGIFKMPDGTFAIFALDENGELTGDPIKTGFATMADAETALAELDGGEKAETPAAAQPPAKPQRVKSATSPVDAAAARVRGLAPDGLTAAETKSIVDAVMARLESSPAIKAFGVAGGQAAAQPPDAKAAQAMKVFTAALRGDKASIKALQMDSDAAGGFTVVPMEFTADLLKGVDNQVYMRQWAKAAGVLLQIEKATSLGVPTLASDPDDADWTSELATGSEDSGMAFGGRSLTPHPLAKRIKVSKKLIRASALNVVSLVRDRLGYKFGVSAEKGYLTGSGAERPLGLFVASDQGVPTSRDTTASSTTDFNWNDLVAIKYSVKAQYWPRLKWVFGRTFAERVAKLVDGVGRPLFIEASQSAQALPTLLGIPCAISEYAPSTFTTGQYVAALYDPAFYWMADALDMEVQILDQLYAESNQMGYIGRLETDGMPVLAEAFARLKLA